MRGNNFLRLLQTRFGTGKRFTSAYLTYFQKAQNVKLETEDDWNRLGEPRAMWFHYALSTNQRGEALIQSIEPFKKLRGARYLDIGCGFGGHLIAAARHGAQCVGIEPDPLRADFSAKNIADFNLKMPVLDMDALTPNIEAGLGTFDIVTCNDVAEHVDSAERLLMNLGRLLRPGGLAYLEIPNGDCIDFVTHDGHFGLFGITLIPREQANAYHWERFHFPYDVGDYWKLQDYFEFFRRAGLNARLVPSLHHPTLPISELDRQLSLLENAAKPDPAIDAAYREYRSRLDQDRLSMDEEAFRNRYLRNFWTFLATM